MLVQNERSVGELLGDIKDNLERLIRAEIRLVKATGIEWIKEKARGAIIVAVGGVVGLLTISLLLWAAVSTLSSTMKPWAATLVVAGGTAVIAIAVVMAGLRMLRTPLRKPHGALIAIGDK